MKCVETNETLGNEPGDSQILLPPKQFLLMLHTRFFHQNDWNTDLFVQSHFWANVERVCNNYSPSIDEPWAIAFNTIILLSLSTDGSTNRHEPLIGSQFAQPFFSTIRAAVDKFWILMSPRLINVQTLVLLSIAAELFYPPNLAEALLARACLLARQMGLNQSDMVDKGVSPEEQEERLKVYRSLYIRDKSLGVSRGTVCWLPGFEIQRLPSDESDSGEASYNTARVRIAAFQERVYRLHSSANAQGDFANNSGFHPSGIQNGLQELLRSENIFEQPTNIPDIDLWLEFLATRIIALRRNPKSKFIDRTLQDARASCILLLMALEKSSEALSRRLEKLCDLPGNSEDSNSPINPTLGKFSAPMLSRSPLDIFPVSAFFLLAATIIRPMTSSEQTIGEDLDLLLRMTSCYEEANEKLGADNRAHRLGRAFEKILRIVDCTQNPDGTPAPSLPTANGSSNDTRSIGSNLLSLSLSKSYPEMADMKNLSAQNSFVSGAFPNQQNAQLPSDGFGSYIASEPDNMNTFMIPPQHLDQGSNFQFDGNSMMSDASFDVAQAQLAADGFGFDMSLTS
jgi:Fungal specific transcription factor domain